MASYLDNPTILGNFSPYVQQLPVEAMSSVGMQKQAQYNEGIQRIQSTIDNVAGLDVIRDVDKQYLQSKLDELGSDLKTVAAGDFSNFQLVNSTAGMVGRIAKDKFVQNAVSNTSAYRKQLANIETAKKEGKSAIQNEWAFSNDADKWLSSSRLEDKFNASYTPYIDVDKKFLDVLKNLHSDLREIDIPFETNPDGSINYGKTAASMQRMSREYVSKEKLEGALKASLSPDELNQLGINGRYQFRGQDGAGMGKYFEATIGGSIKKNEKEILNKQEILKTTKAGEEYNNIALSIEDLKKENDRLRAEMSSEIKFALENPEAAKEYIYKNETIRQFADNYSWEHKKVNNLTNPNLEADHWEKKYALDKTQMALNIRAQELREQEFLFDKDIRTKTFNAKYGNLFAGTPFEAYAGESTEIIPSVISAEKEATALEQEALTGIEELAKVSGASISVVEGRLAELEAGNTDVNIPNRFKEAYDNLLKKRIDAKAITNGIKSVRTEIENSKKYKDKNAELVGEVRSLPNLIIEDNQIGKVSFTQDEIFNYIRKEPQITKINPYGVPEFAKNTNLTGKEEVLEKLLQTNKDVVALVGKYKSLYNNKFKPLANEIDAEVETEFSKRNTQYLGRLSAINFNEKSRNEWLNNASIALKQYAGGEMGIEGGNVKMSKDDVERGQKWLGKDNKKDILFKKLEQDNRTYLQMSVAGEKDVLIPLTEKQAEALPKDEWSVTEGDKRLTKRLDLGNGNTNPNDSFSEAMYMNKDFPNIKRLNVRADVTRGYPNEAVKYLRLRLMVGGKPLTLDLDTETSSNNIQRYLPTLTDEIVKELFLQSPEITKEQKELIKNL